MRTESRSIGLLAFLAATLVPCTPVQATDKTWDGGAGTNSWQDGNNWNPNGVPGTEDDVTITGPAKLIVLFPGGNSTVKSVACDRTLAIQGGGFAVTGAFTITGGGTLSYSGGTITGTPTILGSTLEIGASASAVASFVIGGTSTLQGDLQAGQSIWVKGGEAGHALLLLPTNMVNNGTLRIESVSSSWNSDIAMSGGTLTNSATGIIAVNQGSFGPRTLATSIRNLGQISVEAGVLATMTGAAPVLEQAAGTINAPGRLRVQDGAIHLTGGQTLGNVSCSGGAIDVEATVTLPSTVQCETTSTALVKNASAATTVRVAGGINGDARLNTLPGASNAGTILLQSVGSSWISSIRIQGGSFRNEGLLAVGVGSFGPRECDGGTLVNAGSIWVEPGTTLIVRDGFTVEGGVNTGDMRVSAAVVSVTASPAVPTEVELAGSANLLATDNLPNVTLWVKGGLFGDGMLEVQDGRSNRGVLRIESAFSSWVSAINAPKGTFTNGADGVIDVRLGSFGPRTFTGNLTNLGTINVDAGSALVCTGVDHVVEQAGGTINANGPMIVLGGTLHMTGGQSLGLLSSRNGTLDIEASVAAPSQVRSEGTVQLVKNASAATALRVTGGASGDGILVTQQDAFNAGTLALESLASSWASNISIGGGSFLNNGLLSVRVGTFGPRFCSGGTLVNAGTITVEPGTTFSVSTGFDEAGGTNSGDMIVSSAVLSVTQSPAAPIEIVLAGTANTLVTDNLADVTLWVKGGIFFGGLLTIQDGLANHGVIRLESTGSSWESNLAVVGQAASAGTLTNAVGGIVRVGQGTGGPRAFSGNLLNAGRLEPGFPSSLAISGTYEQLPTGTFACEFAGPSAGQFSSLAVGGDAFLAGAITAARVGGYQPSNATAHAVLNAASRTGTFTSVESCDGVLMSYTPTQARLTFTTVSGVVGDLNGDGHVNGADLGLLLGSWGPCSACCPGDLTGDGVVNGADLGALLGNWG